MLSVFLPAGVFLIGLEVFGTGWAYGPSWSARALAWTAVVAGSLAAGSIARGIQGEEQRPTPVGLQFGLALWVGATGWLLWCAFPAPLTDRVEALARESHPDARTFRTLALELLDQAGHAGKPLPEATSLMSLACHRHLHLQEPSSGLALAALADRGALRFWSSQEIWGRLQPQLRVAAAVTDGAARLARVEELLWTGIGGGPPAALAAADRESLGKLEESLARAGAASASGVLVRLARCADAAVWREPLYHTTAAHALALAGRGPDAALELELARRCPIAAPPEKLAAVELLVAALASKLYQDSRRARMRLQEDVATDLACDAWVTDPKSIPPQDEVTRSNLETGLQERLRGLELRPSVSVLAQVLAGSEADQLAAWNAPRRAVVLARGLALAGRRDEAMRVLARLGSAGPDPYPAWVAQALSRAP